MSAITTIARVFGLRTALDAKAATTDLTAEASTRATADATNATAIASEATSRASGDATNATAITNEATARASADTTLQTNITNEATARAAADTTLQTNITNEATARASADTTEATTRAAADTALAARSTKLESHADVGGATYDLDAMPAAYTGTTDAEALQWAVNRLLLTDAGAATERNVTILIPARVVDVTSATVQETGTLGTYGLVGSTYGTRKGANAQILIPATGNLATKKCLVLTLRVKQPSVMGYSVVNGDGLDVSVPPTTSVIKSDYVGMGNVAMIGASRSLDGYAGLYFSLVQLRTEGVTFRATEGITALDASHLFSWQGDAIADTGVSSSDIRDPRREDDGTWFVEGVTPDEDECDFEFRQFAFKTPHLWNGGSIDLRYVAMQGYRYGIDINEHVRLGMCFPLYCFVGVKLMGQSHTSILDFVKPHRSPYGIEGPEAGGWFGNDPAALTVLRHYGGEGYHPGEFGNPAGDRWFNHRSRFSDPNNLWYGWAEYHPSTSEDPDTTSYATIPDGEGENLNIRRMLDPLGGTPDFLPEAVTLTDGATITATCDPELPEQRFKLTLAGAGRTLNFSGVADGMKILIAVIQDGTGSRTITTWGGDGLTIAWEGGAAPTLATAANSHDLIRMEVVGSVIYASKAAHGTVGVGGGGGSFPTISSGSWFADFNPDTAAYNATTGGTVVTTNGAAIARLEDLIDGDDDVMQGTSGNRPTLATAAINGLSAAQFVAASSQYLNHWYGNGDTITHAAPNTVFCVFYIGATGAWQAIFDSASGSNGLSLVISPSNVLQAWSGFAGGGGSILGPTISTPGWHYAMVKADGASSVLHVDGTDYTGTLANGQLGPNYTLSLGAQYDGAGLLFTGKIARWFGASGALDTTDTDAALDYILDEYGPFS